MSFGIFESAVSSEAEAGIQRQAAVDQLAAAVYDVREKLGPSLFQSSSIEEFRDRVAMMKHDQSVYRIIEPHLPPVTGVVRRIVGKNGVLETEFRTLLAGGCCAGKPDSEKCARCRQASLYKGAPFAGYTDFDDCTSKNSDKGDSSAYCGEIKHRTEDKTSRRRYAEEYSGSGDVEKESGPFAGDEGDFPIGTHKDLNDAKNVCNFPSVKRKNPSECGEVESRETPKKSSHRRQALGPEDVPSTRTPQSLSEWQQQHPQRSTSPRPALGPVEHGDWREESPNTRSPVPYRQAEFADAVVDTDSTFSPSDGQLKPKGNFKAYLDKMDQGGPEKVRRHNFAKLGFAVYADWCGANGLSPGRLSSLDAYASYLTDDQYMHLAAVIQACDSTGMDWEGEHHPKTPSTTLKNKDKVASPYSDRSFGPGMDPGESRSKFPSRHPKTPKGQDEKKLKDVTAARDPLRHYIAWCDHHGLKRLSARNVEYYAGRDPQLCYHLASRMRAALRIAWERQAYHPKEHDWFNPYGANEEELAEQARHLPPVQPRGQHELRESRRRYAAPDYLQKADEALTNLLNQKAEEFQQTIAPLQQALQTVQQAEQIQQAQNPLNVLPPPGSVNVMPNQQGNTPAQIGMPDQGAPDTSGLAGLLAGGMPPGGAGMGGAGGEGGPPPAAAAGGALPPDLEKAAGRRWGREVHPTPNAWDYDDYGNALGPRGEGDGYEAPEPKFRGHPGTIVPKRGRRGGQGKGSAAARRPRQAASVTDLWNKWQKQRGQSGNLGIGGDQDYQDFAQQFGVGQQGIEKLRQQHGRGIGHGQGVMVGRRRAAGTHDYDPSNPEQIYAPARGHGWEHSSGPSGRPYVRPQEGEGYHKASYDEPGGYDEYDWPPPKPKKKSQRRIGFGDGEVGLHPRSSGIRGLGSGPGEEFGPESPSPMLRAAYFAGASAEAQRQWEDDYESGVSRRSVGVKESNLADSQLGNAGISRSTGGSRGASSQQRLSRQSPRESGVRNSTRQHAGHGRGRETMAAGQDGLPSRTRSRRTQSDSRSASSGMARMSGVHENAQLSEATPRVGFSRDSGRLLSADHERIGWSGWGPAQFPRTREVPGWKWDSHLNGYFANHPEKFSCKCGSTFDTPSGYQVCAGCGTAWNSYVIDNGGSAREAAAKKFLVREIPARKEGDVIVASRRQAEEHPCPPAQSHAPMMGFDGSILHSDGSVTRPKKKPPAERWPKHWTAAAVTLVDRSGNIHRLIDPGEVGDGEDPGLPSFTDMPRDWAWRGQGQGNKGQWRTKRLPS